MPATNEKAEYVVADWLEVLGRMAGISGAPKTINDILFGCISR